MCVCVRARVCAGVFGVQSLDVGCVRPSLGPRALWGQAGERILAPSAGPDSTMGHPRGPCPAGSQSGDAERPYCSLTFPNSPEVLWVWFSTDPECLRVLLKQILLSALQPHAASAMVWFLPRFLCFHTLPCWLWAEPSGQLMHSLVTGGFPKHFVESESRQGRDESCREPRGCCALLPACQGCGAGTSLSASVWFLVRKRGCFRENGAKRLDREHWS